MLFKTLVRAYTTARRTSFKENLLPISWQKLVDRYPEFLPEPQYVKNTIIVYRQIDDMLKRRSVIDIPEFYTGSILAVTASDQFAESKKTRFVGICIQRGGQLKKACFTLRNVIEGMGCEIRYELYNPLLLSIEVLKLEKRLDDDLTYLRDALPEYSMVPEDMKPVPLPDGVTEAPINRTLVKLKPQPWTRRWERHLLRGVESFPDIPEYFAKKVAVLENDPVYTYDLMNEYRTHVTEETMYDICKRIAEHEKEVVHVREEAKAKRFLRLDKKPLTSLATPETPTTTTR